MNNPIFIGGLSFSGKTPLRLMLSSHSNIALSRRTYMWQRYYGRFGDISRMSNFERCLKAMLADKTVQALSPDPDRLRIEYWQGQPGYGRLFALVHQHFAQLNGRRRWGAQIGLIEAYADIIFADYSDARMIHMISDPRTRQQTAAARKGARTATTGWETARWIRSAELASLNLARYPESYLIVNNEELVANPERVIRRICDFIGERFEPTMLSAESAVRFGSGKDSDAPASATTLSRRDIAFTQAYAGRQIAQLGYELRPLELSLKDRVLFNMLDRPANLASMWAWRTLEARRS